MNDTLEIKVEDSVVTTTLLNGSGRYVSEVDYNNSDVNSLFAAIEKSILLVKEDAKNGWPEYDDLYYTPEFSEYELIASRTWRACRYDRILKDKNLIFRTKEDAIAAAKKMLKAIQRDNKNESNILAYQESKIDLYGPRT